MTVDEGVYTLEEDPVWESVEPFSDGVFHFGYYLIDDRPVFRIPNVGVFFLYPDRIHAHLEPGSKPLPFLLGRVFGLWLEWSGYPVLHGACIEISGCGVGFLGAAGDGKSTISAAFWSQGYPVLCDDLIVLDPNDFLIHPGVPESRLWPDSGRLFLPGYETLPKVHDHLSKRKVPDELNGTRRFAETARPPGALIVLNRDREGNMEQPQLHPLKGGEAMMALVRHGYGVGAVHAMGLQARHMKFLADIINQTPVFNLHYPSGFDHLPKIRDLILERVATKTPAKAGP